MTLGGRGGLRTHKDKGFLGQSTCCSWPSLASSICLSISWQKGEPQAHQRIECFSWPLSFVEDPNWSHVGEPPCWLYQDHLVSQGFQSIRGEEWTCLGCLLLPAQWLGNARSGLPSSVGWARIRYVLPAPETQTSSLSLYHLLAISFVCLLCYLQGLTF